ncbi:unnamed protein product [Danaus chrysippus]|uniref:(African queen) hypothetical protein n=1 Tax=Danaus chrysippus TaxID=151541 RepID=A0A8J2QCY8_9NEOP|nr:unnamed protein product [Danaus chrysippus]
MSTRYVKIYYGPYEAFYTVCHKPQKLRGLRDKLQKLGFRVDLVPVDFVNLCVLEMCGHEVFRCNICNLSFNSSSERDPVCQRAVAAVLEGSSKFLRARSYLWSCALIEEQIFRRSEFAPKDYWPFDFKNITTCDDCVCCDKEN